jgi:serine phosphatase RsbU (regulator of sigma subunit)
MVEGAPGVADRYDSGHHGRPPVALELGRHELSRRGGVAAVEVEGGSGGSPSGHRSVLADMPPTRGLTPVLAKVTVAVVGLVITASVAWTAWTLNRHNEHRLLEVQTRQAAAVLSSSILSLRDPLETALQIESATGGSTTHFDQFTATIVGPGRPFVSAVLWTSDGSTWTPVRSVGARPLMALYSTRALTLIRRAATSPTFVVAPVPANGPRRIGYAVVDPKNPGTAIYAERAIPVNRVVPVESGSAFSDLDFATYLGTATTLSSLATTDLPLDRLPISGDAVRVAIPFGNSRVTLVAAPRGPLGGALGGALPWVFLVGGAVVVTGSAFVTYQLVRRRRGAEQDARTIAGLYGQLDGLYGEQRSIAESLQQALLPQRNPSVPNLEIATRYVAGTDGMDIGGDWFSLIEISEHRFAFVVGDVSGKGVGAAAIMARLRFTIRAYLTEGHPPEVVLEMCSRQLSVNEDGHLSTTLVGMGDTVSGVITLANAGHLNPLLVSDTAAGFVTTEVGLPLGVAPASYSATTVRLASGSSLIAFTDGLVERRGESIDTGLDRLLRAAGGPVPAVDQLLSNLVATLGPNGSDDDVAMLAFRWTDPLDAAETPSTRLDRVR